MNCFKLHVLCTPPLHAHTQFKTFEPIPTPSVQDHWTPPLHALWKLATLHAHTQFMPHFYMHSAHTQFKAVRLSNPTSACHLCMHTMTQFETVQGCQTTSACTHPVQNCQPPPPHTKFKATESHAPLHLFKAVCSKGC